MKRTLLVSLALGLGAALGSAALASAHGENAQEGFLRMETVTFTFDLSDDDLTKLVPELMTLKGLKELRLDTTKVTDAGLKEVGRLKQLRTRKKPLQVRRLGRASKTNA